MYAAARLAGSKVVPGPGDPDGKGVLGLNPANGNHKLCWGLEVKRLDTITGVFIHDGDPGETGPGLLTIFEDGAGRPGKGVYRGCLKGLDPRLVRRLIAVGRASSSYAEVRTTGHPAGALRGEFRHGSPSESLPR
jgi:hypothetical protein